MGIGKILSDLINERGTNINEVATVANISPSTLYSMIRRDSMKADIDVLIRVAKALGVSIEYFYNEYQKENPNKTQYMTDTFSFSLPEQSLIKKYRALDEHGKKAIDFILEHELARKETDKPKTQFVSVIDIPRRQLPLHMLPASAGDGAFLDSENYEIIEVGPEVPLAANFGVRLTGNSMEPRFADGDIVWVKKQPCLEEGQIGIFILNGEGYCKKYHKDRLESLNPEYDDIILGKYDDLRIVGQVLS